jgi:TPP-dependent pyruvate/acetoin dehydrogenase alpha subunit
VAEIFGQEPKHLELDKQKLLQMYRNMLRIRRFEERLAEESAQGNIPGLLHLYVGEEAVAVGACYTLRKEDYITSTHRGHGHCIAKGGDLRKMMAELFGKETGYCKGRGGSMHIAAPDIGIVGCSGIAGAGIPIAAGVGLSIKLRRTDQVCVSFFGDGSSNTGAFHEGMNLAARWELPVVYVLENNLYAISVPISKATRLKNISDRAAAYGMRGVVTDGMDVLSVYEAVMDAVGKARLGEGPTLVECKTYRYRGHHEGDPKRGETYRTKQEMDEWEKRDCILKLADRMIKDAKATEAELDTINREVMKEIEDAVSFAKESPFPKPEDVAANLFVSEK